MDSNDFRENVERQKTTMHKIKNISMGILIISAGILAMVGHNKSLFDFSKFPGNDWVYPLFSLFIIYGSFRAYRGFKGQI
jgi:hypothetical protein